MGSSLSPEQEALIVDEDEAGWACREDVLTCPTVQVYIKAIGLGAEGVQPDLPLTRMPQLQRYQPGQCHLVWQRARSC
jgi:hypothetical protein